MLYIILFVAWTMVGWIGCMYFWTRDGLSLYVEDVFILLLASIIAGPLVPLLLWRDDVNGPRRSKS